MVSVCSGCLLFTEELDRRRGEILHLLGWRNEQPPVSDVHAVIVDGMGGLGKTLLAHLVYNSIGAWNGLRVSSSRRRFKQCYVSLGETGSDVLSLQQSMVKQVTGRAQSFIAAEAAGQLLHTFSTLDQPLLLLFDKVQDAEILYQLLPESVTLPAGSAVLATTRQAPQAALLRRFTCQPYHTEFLSQQLSRQLVAEILRQQLQEQQVTQEQAHEVADLCGGLPLLLTVTARTLKYNPAWWVRAADDLRGGPAMSGQNRLESDWLRMLQQSYNALNLGLKHAFLDTAFLWCGQEWVAAVDYFGGKLQQLEEHCLVSIHTGATLSDIAQLHYHFAVLLRQDMNSI